MGWWVSQMLESNPALLVSWAFWVIFSICLHELGHGWAAIRLGDDTPIHTGHMTWNPLVHMGWMSLIMFAVTGIAWGAMPVNPSRIRGRHGDALVAAAGPAVNLALAALSFVLAAVWIRYHPAGQPHFYENVFTFFLSGVVLNLLLMLFNLIPAPPLDGSRILASFSRPYAQLLENPNAAIVGLILAFLVGSKGAMMAVSGLMPHIADGLGWMAERLP